VYVNKQIKHDPAAHGPMLDN